MTKNKILAQHGPYTKQTVRRISKILNQSQELKPKTTSGCGGCEVLQLGPLEDPRKRQNSMTKGIPSSLCRRLINERRLIAKNINKIQANEILSEKLIIPAI
ncbi:hypothetical protein H5410_047351 [Solanum commersonii]|uniref:Uncharacterized protein n=1 Tax=Solanum commersonii TaxID=4109 RepID=A0A9J5XGV0_SOLCO|nr:hypothetical protein H5410_047351 [Solanum commersonii]